MDTFLKDTNYQSSLKKKINNLNSPVSMEETVFVVKNLSIRTLPDAYGFSDELYQIF